MIEYGLEWHSLDSYFQFKEQSSAPGTPESGHLRVYAKDKSGTSALYLKDDAGNEREIGPANTVTGTGTANRLAYWSSSSVIAANAALTQNRLVTADANGLPTSVSALTQGQVVFPNSNGLPTGDSTFFWNNTDKELTIGSNAAPSATLAGRGIQLVKSSVTTELDMYHMGSAAGLQVGQRLIKTRGTISSPTATRADDGCFWVLGGHTGSGFNFASGGLVVQAATNWSPTNTDSYITLSTTPTGSTTRVERLRIEASGDISHASGVRHRMLSQNRFRHLNSQARVYRTTAQSIAASTSVALQFDNERYDTDGLHDNATDNTRLTAQLAGKYIITGSCGLDSGTSPYLILLRIVVNGTTVISESRQMATTGSSDFLAVAAEYDLAVNDYVELVIAHTNAVSLDTALDPLPHFAMAYLGE